MRKCCTCKETKEDDEFTWKNRSKGSRQPYCKSCKSQYNKNWYLNHKDEQLIRVKERNQKLFQENKKKIEKLKANPCTDCGNTYHAEAMHFDHLYDKKYNIGNMYHRS